jgi:hypothetical protein
MRLSTIAATALCLSYNAVAIHLPEREALPVLSEKPHNRYDEEKTLNLEFLLHQSCTASLIHPADSCPVVTVSTNVLPSKNR